MESHKQIPDDRLADSDVPVQMQALRIDNDSSNSIPHSPVILRRILMNAGSSEPNSRETSFRRLSRRISTACRPRFLSSSVNSEHSATEEAARESTMSLQNFIGAASVENMSSHEPNERDTTAVASVVEMPDVCTSIIERPPNFFARVLRAASISRPKSWNVNNNIPSSTTESETSRIGNPGKLSDSSPVRPRARGHFANRASVFGDTSSHGHELVGEHRMPSSSKQPRKKLIISQPLPASAALAMVTPMSPIVIDPVKEKLRKEKVNVVKQNMLSFKPSLTRFDLDITEKQDMLDRHVDLQLRISEKIKDYHVYIQGATTLKRASMANGATQDAVDAHLKEFRGKLSELEYELRIIESVIRVLKRQLVANNSLSQVVHCSSITTY